MSSSVVDALNAPVLSTPNSNDKDSPPPISQQHHDDLVCRVLQPTPLALARSPSTSQHLSLGLPHVAAAWKWYRSLGSPRFWVAPLVGLSDKSFRILCRRHGAHICHTEMTDPGGFYRSLHYRTQMMGTQVNNDVNLDRPLILQLGSSNIEKLLQAIELAVDLKDPNTGDVMIDAVELNCGCPQRCAKKGNYGSFLLDPPRQDILLNIIRTIRQSNVLPSSIPLLVKMRVLEGIPETVHLAKCIVEAGAGLLTVHGRTRYQGGGSKTVGRDQVNLASWPHIRAVKQAVPVPVIANGNVPGKPALKEVLEATGCDGVMSGVGILRDPTLFENPDNISVNLTDMAEDGKTQNQHDNDAWNRAVHVACEYIDLAILYQTHPVRVQKHLTWMLDGKGFKNRAPVARQQTLDLKFVKPGDGSDSGGNEDSNDGNRSNETVDWCAEDGNNGVPISNAGEVADVLTCLKKELQESLLSDAHAKTGDY